MKLGGNEYKNYKNRCFLYFSILVLFSCTNRKQNTDLKNNQGFPIINNVNDSSRVPNTPNVSFILSNLKILNFGTDSLSDSLVLFSIFGNYEFSAPFISSDDSFVSVWKCDDCPSHRFEDRNQSKISDPTIDYLPYFTNYTSITQKKYFKDSLDIEYCLVSFSTSKDYPAVGRYSSGLLSLVLFKNEKYWKIEILIRLLIIKENLILLAHLIQLLITGF